MRLALAIFTLVISITAFPALVRLDIYKPPMLDSIGNRPNVIPQKINFALPLKYMYITSPFGFRKHPIKKTRTFHKGIDLRANKSTVFSVLDGIVVAVSQSNLLGRYIKVRHMHGLYTIYGHLSKQLVHTNQKITAGMPIGISGNTGLSTAEHLHFGVYIKNKAADPVQFFKQLHLINKAMEKQSLQELIQKKLKELAQKPNQPITLTPREAEILEVQLWDDENIIIEDDE